MAAPASPSTPSIFDALQSALVDVAAKKASADDAKAKSDAASAAYDSAVTAAQQAYAKVQSALAHIAPPAAGGVTRL